LRFGVIAVLLGLVVAAGAVACEDTSEVSGPDSVRLKEWAIELGTSERTAGAVKLQVQNVGTMTHEVIVVRTNLAPDKLPVDSGAVKLSDLEVLGEKDDIERREKTTLDVNLTPGSYVFLCNISGHYALGMRAALVVK
jgi:hypothetical protein